ncbi:hypothetical protein CA850_14430 [Micromonospora echinospora]|uniref:Uncharacterized protein n=1 Tax=Micromonospora echinospora TaxID=1877 RepID=A0A1C4ZA31_MICEC|nr:hypothetical protein [Micromonospora echinospora]OZV80543.1 hypothetical protein CA850_14430 [Micromonospora echinospora]SCF29798.1 hypothetical protein GA0070618_4968 [Micromonospora echinospora]
MSAKDSFAGQDDAVDSPGRRPNGRTGLPFGLRAAVLAGLIVATAHGVPAQGPTDAPVRVFMETGTGCCPEH